MMHAAYEAVGRLVQARLRAQNLSVRQASLRSQLSHNTLRVVLAGARPMPDTCDALDGTLHLAPGTLRLLAGWPLPTGSAGYSEEWARILLELSSWETRQQVITYLLAQTTPAPRRKRRQPAKQPD